MAHIFDRSAKNELAMLAYLEQPSVMVSTQKPQAVTKFPTQRFANFEKKVDAT